MFISRMDGTVAVVTTSLIKGEFIMDFDMNIIFCIVLMIILLEIIKSIKK